MTNKQIILWCLAEISALAGNKNKMALRRVVMLWKIKDEADKRIDRDILSRWGLV